MLRFTIAQHDYKVFLKYSATPKESIKSKKENTKWDVIFTSKEMDLLKDYPEEGRKNVVVLVCTDPKMKNTSFVALDYNDAKACLGDDSINKQRRISISHIKNSPKISVYGTAISDKKAFQYDFNCDKYFGFIEKI